MLLLQTPRLWGPARCPLQLLNLVLLSLASQLQLSLLSMAGQARASHASQKPSPAQCWIPGGCPAHVAQGACSRGPDALSHRRHRPSAIRVEGFVFLRTASFHRPREAKVQRRRTGTLMHAGRSLRGPCLGHHPQHTHVCTCEQPCEHACTRTHMDSMKLGHPVASLSGKPPPRRS